MKKLGLVGGLGPMSTLMYYRDIHEKYRKLAKSASIAGDNPPMIIDSLNLAVAYDLVERKDWVTLADWLTDSINRMHDAGAEFAAIAANTAHIVFDEIQAKSPIPVIGIVDETCKFAKAAGCDKVIVFGTGFTMASGMYEKACAKYGIKAIVPNTEDQDAIHHIIFPNLEAGIVLQEDKARILGIAKKMLKEEGADALILGCTELPLILSEGDLDTKLIDTTVVHIDAIVKEILS
ncbi:putative racemase YgeA [bioreactor metagenome]|uniref:Putative racemase YgeA n=1 Tax=bioreactor metagenome TaxID=1076179 RepID=A0A645ASM9_9ZZZZ